MLFQSGLLKFPNVLKIVKIVQIDVKQLKLILQNISYNGGGFKQIGLEEDEKYGLSRNAMREVAHEKENNG